MWGPRNALMSVFKWHERDFPSPVYGGSNRDESCQTGGGPVDVGRHALMRGLATACPISVRGWSLSYDGHQHEAGLQALLGSSPTVDPSPALHNSSFRNDDLFHGWN